jgi:glyoxylase-like metal-dependent hydrolase (beta-lactamase superfamily II)
MTGPGHVDAGGPPLVEQLSPSVTMVKTSVGPMDNNCYLLRHRSGDTVLIDAANDADRIADVANAPVPGTIVTTHRHADHWQALRALAGRWQPVLYAGSPDADALAGDAGVADVGGLWDGDQLGLGDQRMEVIGLVGHTPGSITIVYHGDVDHLFTGDSLFPGGPGKTTSAADFTHLMDDLESKVFGRFGDDAEVHPGHGDDTTVGAERPQLSQWRARGW